MMDVSSASINKSIHRASLAQMEERKDLNPVVMGSSPMVGGVVMDVLSGSVSQ